MRFQTAQVLEIADISKDTLRHWKRFIPPISDIDGRRRQYTLAELVGICLIAKATQALGFQISQFSQHADALFEKLLTQLPPEGVPQVLCIVPGAIFFGEESVLPDADAIAYIKIRPILDHVASALRHEAPPPPKLQLSLPFERTTHTEVPGLRPRR